MGQFQDVPLGPLLGLNDSENPEALQPTELIRADNVARWGNTMVGTRPGAAELGSTEDYYTLLAEGAVDIQGMAEWRKDFDDTRELVVVADASGEAGPPENLYQSDGQTYAAGTGTQITPGQDLLWTFADHQNTLWAAGGAFDDTLWYLADPTDELTGPVGVLIPKSAGIQTEPNYVFAWRGWLLVCGFRDTTTGASNTSPDSNPSAFRYCTFGQDPKTAANWLVGNTIGFNARRRGVDSFGTNFATGFANYQDNEGQWLLCLGNKHIMSVQEDIANDFRVTDTIAPGSVGQRSFVTLGLDAGDAIYMSPTGTIHSLRQSQQHGRRSRTFLSWKIRNSIANLNPDRIKYSVGAYDPVNGWVVFAVTTVGNGDHDTLLVLDTKDTDELTSDTARWSVWRLNGIRVNDLKYLRAADNKGYIYIGTTEGRILRFDTSVFSDAVEATNGSVVGYTATIQTSHYAYGNPLRTKTLGDVMLTLAPGGDYKPNCTFIFDYGTKTSTVRPVNMPKPAAAGWVLGTTPLPATLTSTDDIVGGDKLWGAGSGQTIGFKITHSTAAEPWRVGNIVAQIEAGGEDVGNPS